MPPNQTVITNKKKVTVEYPNTQSALCPVPCREGLPIPEYTWTVMRKRRIYSKIHTSRGPEFFLNVTSTEKRNITKKELVKDLEWSNNNTELLPSTLQQ